MCKPVGTNELFVYQRIFMVSNKIDARVVNVHDTVVYDGTGTGNVKHLKKNWFPVKFLFYWIIGRLEVASPLKQQVSFLILCITVCICYHFISKNGFSFCSL